MSIRSIHHENSTIWFVADEQGMPFSPGYLSQQQAEDVADLLESSDGMATCPDGIDVSKILQDESTDW